MNLDKENFLRSRFIPLLQQLDENTPARWGKMNVRQMIEHFTDAVMVANGKLKVPLVTPHEQLPKFREFLMSEKPFKENTKNPIMPEEPPPVRKNTKQGAIGKLQEEFIFFFSYFENDPTRTTSSPIFGDLNFEENIQLLYKHALHHLHQFGVDVIRKASI